MERVGVFVNISNQYFVAQQAFAGKVDYEKYLSRAVEGRLLVRAFAYGVQMKNEARDFIHNLKRMGYEPKYRLPRIIDSRMNMRQTDRTLSLAMDVVRCLPKLDTVVLGSNNPDLVDVIQYIKEQ